MLEVGQLSLLFLEDVTQTFTILIRNKSYNEYLMLGKLLSPDIIDMEIMLYENYPQNKMVDLAEDVLKFFIQKDDYEFGSMFWETETFGAMLREKSVAKLPVQLLPIQRLSEETVLTNQDANDVLLVKVRL